MGEFRQHITLDIETPDEAAALFDELSLAALELLVDLLGNETLVANWPDASAYNTTWQVQASHWQPATRRDNGQGGALPRLLEVDLHATGAEGGWSQRLYIGHDPDPDTPQLELLRVWQRQPGPSHPWSAQPDLLSIAAASPARNADRLAAGKVYTVAPERVAALVNDLILDPDRRLPVVLLTPSRGAAGLLLDDPPGFARRTAGLAHVFRLADSNAANRLTALLPRHTCYGGAVRVFLPGFSASDQPWQHRFIPPETLRKQSAGERLEAVAELVIDYAYRASLPNNRVDQLIGQRQRDSVRQQLEADDTTADELLSAWDKIDQLEAELRATQKKLDAKDYALRQARLSIGAPTDVEQPPTAALLLSRRAFDAFDRLDSDEQAYFRKHVFPKLLEPDLVNASREAVPSDDGACWVYPRSRQASGRRVLFDTSDPATVRILELFPANLHDTYGDLRTRGLVMADYRDFQPLP